MGLNEVVKGPPYGYKLWTIMLAYMYLIDNAIIVESEIHCCLRACANNYLPSMNLLYLKTCTTHV
jgi:hypothetical protein